MDGARPKWTAATSGRSVWWVVLSAFTGGLVRVVRGTEGVAADCGVVFRVAHATHAEPLAHSTKSTEDEIQMEASAPRSARYTPIFRHRRSTGARFVITGAG